MCIQSKFRLNGNKNACIYIKNWENQFCLASAFANRSTVRKMVGGFVVRVGGKINSKK